LTVSIEKFVVMVARSYKSGVSYKAQVLSYYSALNEFLLKHALHRCGMQNYHDVSLESATLTNASSKQAVAF
jgi:hypothetical protein